MNEKVTSIPELFGSMVFTQEQMRQRLPAHIYDAWQQCLVQGTSLDRSIADEIAAAMKDWAIEKGATHYTHWFQPMTGFTAEKHDGFITPHRRADGAVRQGAVPGRGGRLQLPLRRPAGHLRGPGLHRLGPHVLRLCEGQDPVYPHHFLFLRRRDSGQKDPPAAFHEAAGHPEHPHPAAVRQHPGPARHRPGGPGAGVFPHRQGDVPPPGGPGPLRPDPVRRQAPQGSGAGRPLLRGHQAPGGGIHA